MDFKMSSAKWRPFCFGPNVLINFEKYFCWMMMDNNNYFRETQAEIIRYLFIHAPQSPLI